MATVTEYQELASTAAVNLLGRADGYLAALQDAANVVFSDPGFNIDNIIPDSYNYASVPTVNFPISYGGLRPTVTDLGLAGAPEAPSISFDAVGTITLPDDNILLPTNNFAYAEVAYQSILLDPLKSKLLADLLNGGYGIDSNDEAALFNRTRDREVEGAMTRITAAGRSMASRGFALPPGDLAITIDRAYQELQNKTSAASREIFVNSAARFVENRRFTIQQVRELEQVTMAFHNSVQERALNTAKATQELALAVYSAVLTRYRALLEASKVASDVQRDRIQIQIERSRATIAIFQAQISAYEANVRRSVESARLQVELYRGDIDANRALTDGLISRATLQAKVIEATVQQNIQISAMTIEAAKAKLLATVQALQFQTKAAEFGSNNFFAALSAMYGSINSLTVQSKVE